MVLARRSPRARAYVGISSRPLGSGLLPDFTESSGPAVVCSGGPAERAAVGDFRYRLSGRRDQHPAGHATAGHRSLGPGEQIALQFVSLHLCAKGAAVSPSEPHLCIVTDTATLQCCARKTDEEALR